MKLSKVRDWLEIVGLFAVVLSLVFVGLQIKQTHEIALANQYQARADYNLELGIAAIENEALAAEFGQSYRAYLSSLAESSLRPGATSLVDRLDELTDEQLGQQIEYLSLRMKQLDNLHYQYTLGLIEPEEWEAYQRYIDYWDELTPFSTIFDYQESSGVLSKRFVGLIHDSRQARASDS
jgi:hypothetical protein